ncbi:hypothetical protein ACFC08_37955 [Streptomyces sp. NPDC056112]|uniref:hypothetical protein n=1 Tax=unclassified Streptomyces TaxID=2593676 RepID=UPI001CD5834C|nr:MULTISPECIES: hypothetical protein [unclassified Streptomyces]
MEGLYAQDKLGKITAKGGATEWIHWQSGTAQLLPRLIARRTRGPLFLTDRKAPAGTAALDVCPETGRARLSYRRAEEIFEESTRLLVNPLAAPDSIEDLDGWTLHRLRHSALTHDAEGAGAGDGGRLFAGGLFHVPSGLPQSQTDNDTKAKTLLATVALPAAEGQNARPKAASLSAWPPSPSAQRMRTRRPPGRC